MAGFVGSFAICLRICWPLRRERWFWVQISVLIVLHLLALFGVDWSAAKNWTGFTFIPFMFADVLIILGTVYLIYRALHGRPKRLVESEDRKNYADRWK
jgi:cell division protein FtsW (lipid II flippase)